ncbi:A disintegrin and metalloproteinase with thrombospondin motifs like [Panulirus ornatus]|uniref:A disintegrin and metalloproteinase with thrombospondin motifs like n=1 Tax=Panulirus ornatus TaxID=150431 RepID=UPI003A843CE1
MSARRGLLLRVALACVSCLATTATPNSQIHQSMSTEDLQRVFHVDSHDQVPAYDVVRLRSRLRRSADREVVRTVHLRALGSTRVINLRPNLDLARRVPLFYADRDDQGGVTVTPSQYEEDVGIPHQDMENMAAVTVSHHPLTGLLTLDGTVGEDLVLRPLPPHLNQVAQAGEEEEPDLNQLPPDDEFFMDDLEDLDDQMVFSDGLPLAPDDEDTGSLLDLQRPRQDDHNTSLPEGLALLRRRRASETEGFHVVFKRASPKLDTDYAFMEMDHIPARSPDARPRRKRSAPYIIYPEILVLVDYDGYLLHGQDNSQIKSYYVSFWNGVDLRYKLLKGPRVKISIAGIIISRSRDAMPYLEKNRVGRDAIDSASALTDMGKYLYQERRLPTYDIAVAITKYDLCRRRKSGRCTTGTAGFAYVGGACVVNKRLRKVNSVAIVEDTGGFSGIIVAAHEAGHLLGAVHDGSPPPSYLGGPGARRCRWEDGYIMSDLRHTEKGFRWSSCSVEQFHHFLNGDTATCLYNLPHEDESLPRVLPGKLLSLDAQCKKDRGTSACFKDDRVCAQLFCFDSSSGYCVSYRPAAEGSDCGNGKICSNGRCVYDNGNSISDFDINRSGEHFIFQSTQIKPVYTDPPTSTTPEPDTLLSTASPRNSWWNSWERQSWGPDSDTTSKTTTTTITTTTTTTTTATTPSPPKDLKKNYKEPLKTAGEFVVLLRSTPGNCWYTRYMQVHQVQNGTPGTCRYTRYRKVHQVHAGTPGTCRYTRYRMVHQVHAGTPGTCRYTRYMQVHQAGITGPSTRMAESHTAGATRVSAFGGGTRPSELRRRLAGEATARGWPLKGLVPPWGTPIYGPVPPQGVPF